MLSTAAVSSGWEARQKTTQTSSSTSSFPSGDEDVSFLLRTRRTQTAVSTKGFMLTAASFLALTVPPRISDPPGRARGLTEPRVSHGVAPPPRGSRLARAPVGRRQVPRVAAHRLVENQHASPLELPHVVRRRVAPGLPRTPGLARGLRRGALQPPPRDGVGGVGGGARWAAGAPVAPAADVPQGRTGPGRRRRGCPGGRAAGRCGHGQWRRTGVSSRRSLEADVLSAGASASSERVPRRFARRSLSSWSALAAAREGPGRVPPSGVRDRSSSRRFGQHASAHVGSGPVSALPSRWSSRRCANAHSSRNGAGPSRARSARWTFVTRPAGAPAEGRHATCRHAPQPVPVASALRVLLLAPRLAANETPAGPSARLAKRPERDELLGVVYADASEAHAQSASAASADAPRRIQRVRPRARRCALALEGVVAFPRRNVVSSEGVGRCSSRVPEVLPSRVN